MDAPVAEGDVLAGKYKVEEVLGVGGMGVVVAAKHLQLDQKVALKFLLPQALEDPEVVARFAREARAASKIKSEHVARVLDVGNLDTGAPFMVREFLKGKDLGAEIEEEGKVSIPEACDYILQACEAVAEAHVNGIVHRDLKPKNLFLSLRSDGSYLVKVLDFGISKSFTGDADVAVTKTTAIMGSPVYMSPEQLRASRDVDARADIWSLGVILYELVTGQLPFSAPTIPQLCSVIMFEKPQPVTDWLQEVPEAFQAIIDRCLEKTPATRYQHVGELANDLARLAPASAQLHVERISRMMSAAGMAPVESVRPVVRRDPNATADTATDWANSHKQLQRSSQRPAPSPSMHVEPPAKPASKLPLILGGVAVLAVAAGVAVMATKSSGASSNANAPASAPSPAKPEPKEELVQIKIGATPTGAKIFLDDAALPANPYVSKLRKESEGHRVRAELAGHVTQSQFVVFDKDVDLKIELVPVAEPAAAGPAKPGRPGPAAPGPGPAKPPGKKGGGIEEADPYKK